MKNFPDFPDLLSEDPIPGVVFVFGSNEAGRHGKGAALTAYLGYGAVRGQGAGRQGASYAIPTKDRYLKPLRLDAVHRHVKQFLAYARSRGALFLVTRIGCGEAGYTDEQIAPLFADAPANCILPEAWRPWSDPQFSEVRHWHARQGPQ